MNATELAVNRRNTSVFIASNPHQLVLIPRTKVKTNTGGTTWREERPRPPQMFRIIEGSGSALLLDSSRVPGGVNAESDFMLLGEWNAVIGKDDIFTYLGDQWEVTDLIWANGYEQRARVRRNGR